MAHPEAHIEIHAVRSTAQRPPWDLVELDLTLHNLHGSTGWFALPKLVSEAPPGIRSVSGARAYALPGGSRGLIVRLEGAAGWQCIPVAAGCTVRLHGLPIDWWRPASQGVPRTLDCAFAEAITVDGEALGAWIGLDLEVSESVELIYDLETADFLGGRETDDYEELPLALHGERSISVPL